MKRLHKTNNWNAKENARRYLLHQRIKDAAEYSAKGRLVCFNDEDLSHLKSNDNRAYSAILELCNKFGYNVQQYIKPFGINELVRISQKHARPGDENQVFKVTSITGTHACIVPTKGRWRRPRTEKIKYLYGI